MKRYTKASPPTESIRAAKSMSAPDSIVTKTPPPPRHRTGWYVDPTDYVFYPARHQAANYVLLVLPWCHLMKPSAFAKAYSPECVEGVSLLKNSFAPSPAPGPGA
jgi:hypothetical protein